MKKTLTAFAAATALAVSGFAPASAADAMSYENTWTKAVEKVDSEISDMECGSAQAHAPILGVTDESDLAMIKEKFLSDGAKQGMDRHIKEWFPNPSDQFKMLEPQVKAYSLGKLAWKLQDPCGFWKKGEANAAGAMAFKDGLKNWVTGLGKDGAAVAKYDDLKAKGPGVFKTAVDGWKYGKEIIMGAPNGMGLTCNEATSHLNLLGLKSSSTIADIKKAAMSVDVRKAVREQHFSTWFTAQDRNTNNFLLLQPSFVQYAVADLVMKAKECDASSLAASKSEISGWVSAVDTKGMNVAKGIDHKTYVEDPEDEDGDNQGGNDKGLSSKVGSSKDKGKNDSTTPVLIGAAAVLALLAAAAGALQAGLLAPMGIKPFPMP